MRLENEAYERLSPAVRKALQRAPYDFLATDAETLVEDFGERVFLAEFAAMCDLMVQQRAFQAYGPDHPQVRRAA